MSLLSPNLKAFMAVIRQGTVHGAAIELKLTQTGVTQRIRSLEKEMGTTLFLRGRKGMRPTQEGEALQRYCKGTQELEAQILGTVGSGEGDRPVSVTILGPTSVMCARIVDQCSPLYSEWPHLGLNFQLDDSSHQLGLLRSGAVDLAILPPEQITNEMDSKMLKPEKYLLVGPGKWRGRKLTDILEKERAIDFYAEDSTTLDYLKHFGLLEHLHRPRLYANNNDAIIRLFRQGIGIGTLTQEVARPYLDSGDLIALNSGATLESPLALAWYPRPEMPAYFKAIIRCIK